MIHNLPIAAQLNMAAQQKSLFASSKISVFDETQIPRVDQDG